MKKIVLGYDESEPAKRALQRTLELATTSRRTPRSRRERAAVAVHGRVMRSVLPRRLSAARLQGSHRTETADVNQRQCSPGRWSDDR